MNHEPLDPFDKAFNDMLNQMSQATEKLCKPQYVPSFNPDMFPNFDAYVDNLIVNIQENNDIADGYRIDTDNLVVRIGKVDGKYFVFVRAYTKDGWKESEVVY